MQQIQIFLAVCVFVMQIVDIAQTCYMIRRHGIEAESNPIAVWLGMRLTYWLKLIVAGYIVAISMSREASTVTLFALIAVYTAYVYVVTHNWCQISFSHDAERNSKANG
jgi:hypothetical protein